TDTLSLVSEYLKDVEECMDDGDSKVAKEAKLFDALEHKCVVIEVDNQRIAIFTKAPLREFGEQFMRYSIPCKVDGQGAWDVELNLADLANDVTKEVLGNMGFVRVNFSGYGRKMMNDVNVEIHEVKFKADFVVLDYVNKGEPSIMFGMDFLATTKSQVDFELGEIKINLTKFKEGIKVIDLLEEVGSSSEEVVKTGKANRNKSYNINKLTPPPSLRLEEIPSISTIPPQPIYHPLTQKQKEKIKEVLDIKYKELEESKPILEVLENYVIYKKKLDEILIDIGDDMERALAMEAYFNPFKNVIVFKKPVDFLGLLPVQLKILDWGNEGYGTYKKIDGDRDWHARFEIVTPTGRKFNRAFKTKTTTRKLSGKFKTEDVLRKGALEYQGLFTEDEVKHNLFEVYFGKLEVDDKQFDYKYY
ncbi:hypothetical protein Tco_0998710, partial [Tanacetum coccineum]